MKNVLILAYDFPPYVSVGGLRPYSWFKYLKEFGIHPIVVTRQWSNKHGNHLDYISAGSSTEDIIEESQYGTIISAPYHPNLANRIMLKYGDSKFKLIRKIISAYYEFAQFIFPVGPKSTIYFAAKEYLSKNEVDGIVATGDPFVLFKYASQLSRKFNIPWIADYRDPWSQNLNIQNNFFLKKWHSFFEKKYLNSVYAITTVSSFLEHKISTIVKNKKFHILPNGYDPEALKSIEGINQQSEVLSIAFVGSVYDWHPLRSFLKVVSQFVRSDKDFKIRLNFYGINLYGVTYNSDLMQIISNEFPELKSYINVHKKMPNQALLKELAKDNLMLLFNYYSYMGTKIFDYIALKRTILFCYSEDTEANDLKQKYYNIEEIEGISAHLQEDLIRDTNAGYVIKDAKHLLEKLHDLYKEFNENGFIKCDTINEEKYSRKYQVEQLSEIIKSIPSKN